MGRIKSLNRYQKAILIIMIVMIVVFCVLYSLTINKVGYGYKDAILEQSKEGSDILYSGKINGAKAVFTVSNGNAVTFQYGEKIYGPYIVVEDKAAIPHDHDLSDGMIGIEISCGEEIFFRGGVYSSTAGNMFYNEDGSLEARVYAVTINGVAMDSDGNVIDTIEPTVSTIYNLMQGPSLTHKGEWMYWALGLMLCALTAISILFADELFKWSMQFSIRNADKAEPSEWEIMGRYIGWTIVPFFTLIFLIMGLK